MASKNPTYPKQLLSSDLGSGKMTDLRNCVASTTLKVAAQVGQAVSHQFMGPGPGFDSQCRSLFRLPASPVAHQGRGVDSRISRSLEESRSPPVNGTTVPLNGEIKK